MASSRLETAPLLHLGTGTVTGYSRVDQSPRASFPSFRAKRSLGLSKLLTLLVEYSTLFSQQFRPPREFLTSSKSHPL